jgi:hypothetical protein
MGLRSTFASLLSAPVMTLLEERLREIVDLQVEARGLAEPSAVRELNGHLAHARQAIDDLTKELEAQRSAVVKLQDHLDDAPLEVDHLGLRLAGLDARDEQISEMIEDLNASVRDLADKMVGTRKQLDNASTKAQRTEQLAQTASATATQAADALARLSTAPTATVTNPSSKPARTDRGCKIDGCDNKHRARGLCGRHYEMWRRGTLPAIVGANGRVFFTEDGPRFQVEGKGSVAKAATLDGDIMKVEGEIVSYTTV